MMHAKRSLGQNFLMHQRIADRIADAAELEKNDTVFEIGPGTGKLTRALLLRAKKVIAIEADRELYEKLSVELSGEIKNGTLDLRSADVRSFDPESLPRGYKLVANIPYYLTGDILRTFLSAKNQPRSITLLVQKEVALRIARSKKESILSLAVKAYGTPKYLFTVPRGAFVPAPKVDSAVLLISDISRKNFVNAKMEKRFFDLVHAGFAHKRKKLSGNLKTAGFSSEGVAPNVRAEDLSLAAWLALSTVEGLALAQK